MAKNAGVDICNGSEEEKMEAAHKAYQYYFMGPKGGPAFSKLEPEQSIKGTISDDARAGNRSIFMKDGQPATKAVVEERVRERLNKGTRQADRLLADE